MTTNSPIVRRGMMTWNTVSAGLKKALPPMALAVLVASLQGCAMFYQAPAVEIVGVNVVSLGLRSGTAEVVLDVTNESGREMEIRGFLYEVQVKGPETDARWATLGEGFFDHRMVIMGRGTENVRVPVPFEYAALGDAIRSLLSSGEVPYRLKGEVWIGGARTGLQIPFRHEGVLRP